MRNSDSVSQNVGDVADGNIDHKVGERHSDPGEAKKSRIEIEEDGAAPFLTPRNSGFPYELVYKPLEHFKSGNSGKGSDFRVVRILPGTGDETIECELMPSKLGPETVYEALSYCAGDADDYRGIMLNGFPFNTFRSTQEALKRFRSPCEPRIFWIDQMCINQIDVEERATQVLLMRDIYQNAARTQIWLGEAASSPSTYLAFDLVCQFLDSNGAALRDHIEEFVSVNARLLGVVSPERTPQEDTVNSRRRYLSAEFYWFTYFHDQDPRLHQERFKKWYESSIHRESQSWFEAAIKNPEHTDRWLALSELFQRPWWRRCWIVQEAVASGELHVNCGQESLSWEDLSLFLNTLLVSLFYSLDLTAGESGSLGKSLEHCALNHYGVHQIRRAPYAISLFTCLSLQRRCMASDARDRIYATLGLLPDKGKKYNITPSYASSNTVKDVYITAAEAVLTIDKEPDLLCFVTGHELEVGLPSWAPDWNRTRAAQSYGYEGFEAGTSRSANLTVSADRRELKIRGWIVDTIEALGSVDTGADSLDILMEWKSILNQHTLNGDDLNTRYHFYNTIMFEFLGDVDTSPHGTAELFTRGFDHVMLGLSKQEERPSKGWRFFMSKNGRQGMACANAQAGHTIFIPHGAQAPLVLRPVCGSVYQLLGPCCLDGMMYNEVLISESKDEIHSEDICII